jgi:hypothetical protein
MLGYNVAFEQVLSIAAIFRRKNYLYVPLIFENLTKRYVVIPMTPRLQFEHRL